MQTDRRGEEAEDAPGGTDSFLKLLDAVGECTTATAPKGAMLT